MNCTGRWGSPFRATSIRGGPGRKRCLLKAIDVAHRQGARGWELRATTNLSRLFLARGDRDEARQMLSALYNRFTEGAATVDMKEAEALMVRAL